MFDYDIFERTSDSGLYCSDTIQRAVNVVTELFQTDEGTEKVANLFGISPVSELDQRDFWFFYADIFVMQI